MNVKNTRGQDKEFSISKGEKQMKKFILTDKENKPKKFDEVKIYELKR